jgi:hypothetical protein
MSKLHLDYSDGRYYTRVLTDEESATSEAAGCDVVHLEDHIYEAYQRDCGRDAIWQGLWRSISNEQYVRRREKELQPLEDADREIARLKTELASAQRMAKHFEDEWDRARGIDPEVSEHARRFGNEYTCIYPQAGCDVGALPQEWQDSAREILAKFSAARATEGMKYQGCCCSYGNHRLLDGAESKKLRDAGFIVENDTESDEYASQ